MLLHLQKYQFGLSTMQILRHFSLSSRRSTTLAKLATLNMMNVNIYNKFAWKNFTKSTTCFNLLKCLNAVICYKGYCNAILGQKAKMSSCDKPTKERRTQECPILIEESPQKKASTDKQPALPAILRCKVKSNVRLSTGYGVISPLSTSPPLKTETVSVVERDSSLTSNSSEEDTETGDDGLSVLPKFYDGDELIHEFYPPLIKATRSVLGSLCECSTIVHF